MNPKVETTAFLGDLSAASPRMERAERRAFAPRQPVQPPLPLDVDEPLFAHSPALAEAAERARVAVVRNGERMRLQAAEDRAASDARARAAVQRGGR